MPLADSGHLYPLSDHVSSAAWWILIWGVTHSWDWWGSWQWGGQPYPLWLFQGAGGLDAAKQAECSCGDVYMHTENWPKACLAEETSLLEAHAWSAEACSFQIWRQLWPGCDRLPTGVCAQPAGKGQKGRWTCNVAHLPGLAYNDTPSTCAKTLPSLSQKGETTTVGDCLWRTCLLCLFPWRKHQVSQHLGGFPQMDTTQDRVTELQCCHPSAPLFHRPRWSMQVPIEVLSKVQPTPILGTCPPSGLLVTCTEYFWCHLSLARETRLWRDSFVAQSLPSWKGALKGRQLRLLWPQQSSVSSAVMLKVGSDGVWLIWGRYKSGKSIVHQSEEWNLKLSHHLRKTDWRK